MKKYYFLVVSLFLLLLSIIAFSDNLITDVGQKSNSDPKFIIHGLFCFAWFIMLVIQTNFIKNNNLKAHIKLGFAGLFAALGVFFSTMYIFVVIYDGWDNMAPLVKANRFFMLGFGILIALAYLYRKQTECHKRLMFVASFYMLGPILDRAMGRSFIDSMISSEMGWQLTFFGIWTAFFISLIVYDWVLSKSIHVVSSFGFLIYVLILGVSMYL
ncbi:MAG TPA: hypothetical protein PLY70_01920 [Saprospiraceae bacterium]|mgnify:CR=1 FL=1|nr:hypothetical protein [Saprospiraceae bacterium]HPN69771.1 hypothetical protein [Saprospiraceae bacterium]